MYLFINRKIIYSNVSGYTIIPTFIIDKYDMYKHKCYLYNLANVYFHKVKIYYLKLNKLYLLFINKFIDMI